MIFSPVTPADIPLMYAIEQQANTYPWPQSAFLSCQGGSYFSYTLKDADGLLAGFYIGQCIAGQAELFNICVAPAQQGKGYGRQLLQHFTEQVITRQATEAWLEVRVSNQPAIALYEKLGFIQTGIRPNYYQGPQGSEDAVLMSLPIL
ncbi:ribosomal protein S18-alanine N-acetyltransferase [Chromatiaceae bacterium AAb-1]|nr:ribosomal protein S18-alanine N-acetyltransferase [Chromatiaceae bacterium AAb-1]